MSAPAKLSRDAFASGQCAPALPLPWHVWVTALPHWALAKASRARALLEGRAYAAVEDVRALVAGVFAHRLLLTSTALLDGVDGDALVARAVSEVPYDPA